MSHSTGKGNIHFIMFIHLPIKDSVRYPYYLTLLNFTHTFIGKIMKSLFNRR